MRGPSSQDCEKSYARTGIPSENLQKRKASPLSFNSSHLVQIQGLQSAAENFVSREKENYTVNA